MTEAIVIALAIGYFAAGLLVAGFVFIMACQVQHPPPGAEISTAALVRNCLLLGLLWPLIAVIILFGKLNGRA